MDEFLSPHAHHLSHPKTTTILIAQEDAGPPSLIEQNLRRCGYANPFIGVQDGQETPAFLLQTRERRMDLQVADCLSLLDFNKPKVD